MKSVRDYERFVETHSTPRWFNPDCFEHVVEMVDAAILKAGNEHKLPWVEAIVPFYLEQDMISKICSIYTAEKYGWYSARGRVFVQEIPQGSYFNTVVYTKFIFCQTELVESKLISVYKTDFNKISWNYTHAK